jgi:transposase
MLGNKEYNEKLYVSFQLSQKVPANNFYRRLKSILDLRFITQQTKHYYGSEGQKSIDPEVFFKLMLVGYLENINSDRRIIEHASMRLDILFFIGYDIDEPLPWHSTLSRTRKLYGEEVFLSLFRKVLSMCIDRGMVSGKRQAIDSAFIKANASMDSLAEKEVVESSQDYLDELNENDDDDSNENKPTVTRQKKEQVEQHHTWKKKTYKDMPGSRAKESTQLDDNGNTIRPKFLSNHTHYSPTDPDARIAVKPGKPRQLNYSGQISVDTRSHIICGAMANFADRRDSQSLPAILTQTMDNLKPHEIKILEALADTGYSSGDALRLLEFQRITGYIPNFGQFKAVREDFTYDPENDRYICSQGIFINYKKTHSDAKGNVKKQYRSSRIDCKSCSLRSACIGKSFEKTIEDTIDKPYYDQMHVRMQTYKAKIMKKLRSSTVEPVLGTLINFMNMKRVNTRGLELANKHVLLAATVYNLKKYMKTVQRGARAVAIKALKVKSNTLLTFILGRFAQLLEFLCLNERNIKFSNPLIIKVNP